MAKGESSRCVGLGIGRRIICGWHTYLADGGVFVMNWYGAMVVDDDRDMITATLFC